QLAEVCGFAPAPAMQDDLTETAEQPLDERTTVVSPKDRALAADPLVSDNDAAPDALGSALALVGLFGGWVGLDDPASRRVHPGGSWLATTDSGRGDSHVYRS